MCACAEGRYVASDGTARLAPPVHDCAYVQRRDAAVERACREEGLSSSMPLPEWRGCWWRVQVRVAELLGRG